MGWLKNIFFGMIALSLLRRYPGLIGIIPFVLIYQVHKSEKAAIKEAKNKRVGIAGWLYFMIGWLFIAGILMILKAVFDIIVFAAMDIYIILPLFDIAVGSAFVIAAHRLWERKPKADFFALISVIACVMISIVFVGLQARSLEYQSSAMVLIMPFIIAIYLITSERVENTYSKAFKGKIIFKSNRTIRNWLIILSIWATIVFFGYVSSALEGL